MPDIDEPVDRFTTRRSGMLSWTLYDSETPLINYGEYLMCAEITSICNKLHRSGIPVTEENITKEQFDRSWLGKLIIKSSRNIRSIRRLI